MGRDGHLFGRLVRVVREVRASRSCPAVVVVVLFVAIRVDWMSHHLVALVVLVGEQLLQSDDCADDQGDLADHEGLQGQQGQGAEGDRDQSSGLQFQQQQDRDQGFHDLLLLSTG